MIAIYILLDLYIFFIIYVASIGMIDAYKAKKLNWLLLVLSFPFVAVCWLIDVAHNVTLFSIIFWELPRELTLTNRLKRHVLEDTKRGKLARWIAETILNPFDASGSHVD
jgi:hypothetical protein